MTGSTDTKNTNNRSTAFSFLSASTSAIFTPNSEQIHQRQTIPVVLIYSWLGISDTKNSHMIRCWGIGPYSAPPCIPIPMVGVVPPVSWISIARGRSREGRGGARGALARSRKSESIVELSTTFTLTQSPGLSRRKREREREEREEVTTQISERPQAKCTKEENPCCAGGWFGFFFFLGHNRCGMHVGKTQ